MAGKRWAVCGVALMQIICTSPAEKAVSGVDVSILQLRRYSEQRHVKKLLKKKYEQ